MFKPSAVATGLLFIFSAGGTSLAQPVAQHAVAQPTHRSAPAVRARSFAAASTLPAALITETFGTDATSASLWSYGGDACLTAGDGGTPATSIPACGAAAPVDTSGQGALELTTNVARHYGEAFSKVALNTQIGFQAVFTYDAFNAPSGVPGADGLAVVLTNGAGSLVTSTALPTGGALGYVGFPGGYLGIGIDEYGNFSSSDGAGSALNGYPGRVPETVTIRGAIANGGNAYLGGYTGTTAAPQSLPFVLDSPKSATRPTNAPTVRVTLTPAGFLTVEIDPHDGAGYRTAYNAEVVGKNGQPALPPQVYLGFTAVTGGYAQRHQIQNLSVVPLAAPAMTFVPTQIPNLSAWYDASDPTTIAQTASAVSSWKDKSGNGNTLVQAATSRMPVTGQNIDGLGALSFSGGTFLASANAALSSIVENESTTFVVTNATTSATASSVVAAGIPPFGNDPRWDLRLFEQGATHFDFNNKNAGRVTGNDQYAGPAVWTAAGSVSNNAVYLHKNGNADGTAVGPGTTETVTYPFVVGGNLAPNDAVTYPYLGTIGEVIVYHRYLTVAETQSVEGYLGCKWGLQSRLPANHPYRYVCPGAAAAAPIAPPARKTGSLPIPPEIRSANGQLSLSVVAVADANGNPTLTYNGAAIPPTLRLLPGDILAVQLTNWLPTPPAGAGYLNDTNLHFHGLHVSPNAPGDDSIDMIAMPGQTINYKLAIPVTHPPGLYWYHSHAHGEAERQNLNGMSGALIVDGIASYVPAVTNMPERVLIVRDAPLAGQALPAADKRQILAMRWAMTHANTSHAAHVAGMSMAMHGMTMTMGEGIAVRAKDSRISRNPFVIVDPRYRKFDRQKLATAATGDGHCVGTETPSKLLTVNGATVPSIGIRPGERQFWRVVNAGSDTYLDLAVDNAQMQIVALDGVPLASGINTPASMTVGDYVVPPASRVEFIVTGPAAGTTAYLRTKCFDAGAAGPAMPATTLAALDPTSSLADNAVKRVQRVSPKAVAYRFPRSARRVTQSGIRTIATTPVIARTQTLYYSDQNTINGQAYDPGAAPQFYAQSGTFEEWTIVNNSSQAHTFHIHQIHFVVEAINGIAQSQEFVMDNVNVPPATTSGPGSVKLLMDFTDPTIIGTFLLHCHILSHEDAGMMAKIRVGTAPPLATSAATVNFTNASSSSQNVTISGGLAPYAITGCSSVATGVITGTSIAISPVASGSCVFTVSDASGLSTTIGVTVGASAAAITINPNTLSFSSPGAAALNASISGGTAPYHVSGCAGIANAAILSTENGVTVAPAAPGSCSLTISDSASNSASLAVTVNAAAVASSVDNLTFHHDSGRTGWYSSETKLTTTNVAGGTFTLLGTLAAPSGMPAFGKVYAQPLYASAEHTSDNLTHNLVIIATTTDQVYAMDDVTGAVVWEHNFTNAAGGITQQEWTDTKCGDINPDTGIVGTPVIDRALDRMWVVVPTDENGVSHLRLHELSLASGADAVSPVDIAATVALQSGGTATIDPKYNFNRSALLEANGNVYVALSDHCDYKASTSHGWMLSYVSSTLALSGTVLDATGSNTGSNYFLGSIWMGGFGPAADSSGNIFFVTGNGPYDGVSDFAMSVVRVPGNLDLSKANTFTPYGYLADSNADEDLGSGGVMLLPTVGGTYPRIALAAGKCGASTGGDQGCTKYLLNRDSLGGIVSGNTGALWHANLLSGIWGGPAAFQDAAGKTYAVWGGGSPLSTFLVNTNPVSLTTQSSANVGCLECRDQGAQPIVSSNGTVAGSAVVWALKTPGGAGGSITLYAFDALNMSHTLYSGTAGTWTVGSGASYIGGALVSPTVANGRVYVPTDGGVAVFGLPQ